MAKPTRTIVERARRVEGALQRLQADRPVRAVELAPAIGVPATCSHESMRRRVREAVKYAQETLGVRICASDGAPETCGYWLARSHEEWARYREARTCRARFAFVAVRKTHDAVSERMSGQAKLCFAGMANGE